MDNQDTYKTRHKNEKKQNTQERKQKMSNGNPTQKKTKKQWENTAARTGQVVQRH